MSLRPSLWQLAQRRRLRGGRQDVASTRRRVRPVLEVLEDRLTPSGNVLAFTTTPQDLSLGLPSQAITIQLQDGSGKAVTATRDVTVNLSSTSNGGQFLGTSGNPPTSSRLIIPKGASSASFQYEDSQAGVPTLEARAPALNLQTSQQENVGVWLVVSPPGQTIPPGQPSQPITVQLNVQPLGGQFMATSPVTIQLSSSSSTGQFLDASGKVLPNGRLTVPAGSNSATFAYKDSKAGMPELTASLDGASTTTQVNVGTSLVFTTHSQTLKAGQMSQLITVQLQDSNGKAITAPNTLQLSVLSNSQTGTVLVSQGYPFPPFFSIPTGTSSVSFLYEDSVAGKPTLTANVSSVDGPLCSATQQETVTGPYKVVLGTPPQMIAQNAPSSPITIQLLDSTGNTAKTTAAVTVQLSSTSSTSQFLDASGKMLPNGRLTIPAGSSSASFEYKDSKAGFPTLTASQNGLSTTMQVNVGVLLVFTTPAQNFKTGQPSGPITVQLQDSHGKAVNAPTLVPVYLSSSSGSGQFLDSSGNPLPYSTVGFQAGSSSFSFKYSDSIGGKPTLSVNASLMNGMMNGIQMTAAQQETVAGPYRLAIQTPPPQMIDQNAPSQPITLQLMDSTGQPAKTASAVTVQLNSSSSTGQFLDASGNLLSNGRLIIPAGASSASFKYRDSQAGFPTLTAVENGFSVLTQVNVGVLLDIATPAQSLKPGQKSQPITVQLHDSNGKAFAAPSLLPMYLNSNSTTGKFLDGSGNPFPYTGFTIQAGASSASFEYEDSVAGKPTLFVDAIFPNGPEMSTTQKETIIGPYNVGFFFPQSLTAITPNKLSQPIEVQLLESTGQPAKATSVVTVQLSSSSSTGQFLDASGKVLPNGRLSIPAGSNSATFEYKDSRTGFPTLTATENGFTSTTQVNVGVSLVITTPAQNFKTGQSSGPITVQLQDSDGKPFTAPSSLSFYLNSSLDTIQYLGLPSSMIPYSITIPQGSSSASFAITSNWGGTPTLTVSQPSLSLSATQQETIQGLSALVFTTSPQTVTVGQKSHKVTLQLEDNTGKATVAPSGGLTIYLGSSSGSTAVTFFDGNGNPLPTTLPQYGDDSALIMPAGSSTVSFVVESTQAGTIQVFAQITNGPSSNQMETFQAGAPKSLVFETPAQTQPAGVPSGSITVQLEDQYGNPVSAGSGGLTFQLHSSSSGGTFLSADGDPLANSTITVPQGLSSATFEYKDSRVGTPTLTASASGLSASQKESITPISAEIHVTNTKDSGSGSLRAAIQAANANPGSTIVFDPSVRGAIDLVSALPAIMANTNILGPGANLLTIERSTAATSDFSIFQVASGADTSEPAVVISGLTVANGTQAGIANFGDLTLQRVVVKNNQGWAAALPSATWFPYGSPGGIGNFGGLTILNSTIANNSTAGAAAAAGIDSKSGSVLIINSTISGNRGVNNFGAGGIGIDGGTALIENSTISGNTSTQQFGASSYVGGIVSDGQVTLYDTIVAGNTGSASNSTDVSGAFISLGHNLIGEANEQASGFLSSDLVGTSARPIDPKLGALANNGGPSPTLALLVGSPALRAGSSVDAPSTDQRGDARPKGAIDIGAFEETTS